MKVVIEIGVKDNLIEFNENGQIKDFGHFSPNIQSDILDRLIKNYDMCFAQFKIEHGYLAKRKDWSQKELLKFLLKQKPDMLKEFVSDMVYYAHKAECQDTLSEEDFVIEKLKKRIADDASN